MRRTQILLASDAGCADEEIARTVQVETSTVYRTKRRFVEESLEAALSEEPRPGGKRKLTGSEEGLLIATAVFGAAEGPGAVDLALLADAVVTLTPHARISRHTIGRRMAENDLKPFRAGRSPPCAPEAGVHYVPKHASWLNMVEIEIGVLASQCLARRIPDLDTLTTEVDAWIAARNRVGVAVKWMLGIEQARMKLGHAYPAPTDRDPARNVAA